MLAQAKAYISIWNIEPNKALMYAEQPLDEYKSQLQNTGFINKSLFAGILWNTILKYIPNEYYNGRFQIFTCIVLYMIEKRFQLSNSMDKTTLESIDEKQLRDILIQYEGSIEGEVKLVCNTIDDLPLSFPKNKSGKIHYRKFYVTKAFNEIYTKYKTYKNNANTTTEN